MTYLEDVLVGASPSGKTLRWALRPKDSPGTLARVFWYAPWRKYVVEMNPEAVFEPVCLREIADFLEAKTKEHKETL